MTFTAADIKKLAALSRVALSPEEEELFATQISSVLSYVDEIQQVTGSTVQDANVAYADTKDRDAAFPHRNILREDKEDRDINNNPGILIDAAPGHEDTADGKFVKVKKILQ
jgi:aspartyl/glutamyl-tRNA(Asn/Gln) amidotransferase C subunit